MTGEFWEIVLKALWIASPSALSNIPDPANIKGSLAFLILWAKGWFPEAISYTIDALFPRWT